MTNASQALHYSYYGCFTLARADENAHSKTSQVLNASATVADVSVATDVVALAKPDSCAHT